MGEVFLARDDRLKRSVAIKRIRHDGEMTPTLRQRLLREAQAVAGLSHPAIVHVYDLLEGTDDDCIIMEYVQGATLAESLKGGPLEPATAVRLAREIASGLDAAHAAGIVHRDLKAENVIVTPAGQAKILDFGLAKPLAPLAGDPSLTGAGFVVGTWRSMSPEQARGAEVDERSDLFSFGVLLYEMLTGQSPFRGASTLEILTRVMSLTPPRVDTVQPGLSPRLGTLTGRLLEKEPDARPQSAAEVVRELAAIAADSASGSLSDETISALPTGFLHPATPPPSQALPPSAAAPPSTAGMSVIHRRGMRTVAVAVLAVALLGAFGFLIGRRFQAAKRPAAPAAASAPLRVVMPHPEVNGGDERLGLAASGVLSAGLNTLASLEGVVPLDPLQLVGDPKSAIDMARVAAADEVLAVRLEAAGSLGRITLRRIHGAEGRVLWTDTFDASIDAPDLRLLADVVRIHLSRGYPEQHPRPGTPTPDVRNEDYTAFLQIKQEIDSGSVPPQNELPRLKRIIAQSPRFLQARIVAAEALSTRFQSTKDVRYRKQALALLREARELAPGDPRPLATQFQIELAGDQSQVAAATLAQLENLLPGDPRIFVWRAGLAEREGRMDEALAGRRTAAERFPSWSNLFALADLEARTGHIDDARRHIQEILAVFPNNIYALNQLARIELLFGNLKQAGQIYRQMIAQAPQRAYFTNLGIISVLLGRYEEAINAFNQALELDPGHVYTTLNLAEAELAVGRARDAQENFQKVLRDIEKNRPPGGFSPDASMAQAQCLAHLGRTREAVELTQKALNQNPDDPNIMQSAALVYALVGDRASALVNTQNAVQRGVKAHWFSLPAFSSLRNDPEFRAILRKTPGALDP
jgi:serine/threonine-protein kinase